jgi:glycosyltransferase involved in cell wall biosynthesis
MHRISIIIPTYNRARLIINAINSILNQTFKDYEIIIVDDCSSDNTREVIQGYSLTNLKYIINEHNYGAAVSRNIGIKNSSGEYIAFLDSDDEWEPTKLEKQYNVLKNSGEEVGVVYTASYQKKKNELIPYLPYKWVTIKEGYIFNELLRNNYIDTPAVLVKKSVFDDVGNFDETFRCLEDYDLFLRVSKKYEFRFVSEYLLISNIFADGLNMRNLSANAEMLLRIWNKNSDEYNSNNYASASLFYNVGDCYYMSNEYKKSRYYYRKSLLLHFSIFTALLYYLGVAPNLSVKKYFFIKRILMRLKYYLTGKDSFFP